jgi:Na+/proline symporter
MISTSVSKDLFKRYLKPDASDDELLVVARIAAVVGGVLGVLLSIYLSTIVQAMTVFYSLLGVSLFAPVVGGLYSKRAGSPEALAAIAAGVVTLLVVRYGVAVRIRGSTRRCRPDAAALASRHVAFGKDTRSHDHGVRSTDTHDHRASWS